MTVMKEWLLLGRLRLEPAGRSERSVNRVPENVLLCMYCYSLFTRRDTLLEYAALCRKSVVGIKLSAL